MTGVGAARPAFQERSLYDTNAEGFRLLQARQIDQAAAVFTDARQRAADAHDARAESAARRGLGRVFIARGEFDRAGQFYQQVLTTFTRLDGPKSEKAIQAVEGLGEVRRMLGDLDGAKQRYLEVIALYTETEGPTHVRTLSAKNDLVAVLANQGDWAAAEPLARENLAAEEAVLGPNHPNVPLTLNLLAFVLGRTARFVEAETTLRRGLPLPPRTERLRAERFAASLP